MKVGIFGGTFNPIHNGHIALIRRLIDILSLDELLLIPTAVPPHKDGGEVISAEHRLNMCRLATADIEKVTVSDIEIRRGGKSYTLNTLQTLISQRPDDEWILLMGSDMFYTLTEWKRPEEIMRLAKIVAIARENGEIEKLFSQRDRLNAMGGSTEVIDICPVRVSSTELRHSGALKNDVPDIVERYIIQNGLYGRELKLLVNLDEITAWLRTRLSRERFAHTLNVASEALRLANTYEVNGEVAYLAGLLHDCCKELSKDEILNILSGSDIINNQTFKNSPKVWHGFAAAIFIQNEFSVLNTEIINAVRYHTTGRDNMSRMEELVYLADLVSADRSYSGVEALRAKAHHSINGAMLEALQYALKSLVRKEAPVMPDTLNAYNCYLIRSKEQAAG